MGYETCTCSYCGRREAMDLSREVRFAGEYGPLCDDCLPLALRVVEANTKDNADPAPDPALLALARLGAWLVETQGDDAGDVDGGEIHDAFERLGVVTVTDVPAGLCFDGHKRDDYCRCCEYFGSDDVARCHHWQPGITSAIARLLAPDGADGAGG